MGNDFKKLIGILINQDIKFELYKTTFKPCNYYLISERGNIDFWEIDDHISYINISVSTNEYSIDVPCALKLDEAIKIINKAEKYIKH